MSYYPILNVHGTKGWTTLSNFSPNNWEDTNCQRKYVNLTWRANNLWVSKILDILDPDSFLTVTSSEIKNIIPEGEIPLLSLSLRPLPAESTFLPKLDLKHTHFPAWRATIGLSTSNSQTSYQGELDAFPTQGSLLTFGPFLQFGKNVENHLILINIESSPAKRSAELEIYDAARRSLRGKVTISSNSTNNIHLNRFDFKSDDLPLFICRNMASIPLYFSHTLDGKFLSLEHTHPPASFVIHGKRWEAQKIIKKRWFDLTEITDENPIS